MPCTVDCLLDKYHQVSFDNLYMSAKFCLGSFQHAKQDMVEGVTRTNQQGLPQEIIQHDVKNTKDIVKVKGTVKVVVLENDLLSMLPLSLMVQFMTTKVFIS